jgi:nitrogen fixation NifU-like protein
VVSRTASTRPALIIAPHSRSYHEAVLDHFRAPRNVGSLDKNDVNVGTALVGKASCGDVIKLQVEIRDGVIQDAKFKAFGCGSAIASSSLATEMIVGKKVEEAYGLKNTDLSSHLKLPPVKIHCSVLAEEAIKGAIDDYQQKHAAAEKRVE